MKKYYICVLNGCLIIFICALYFTNHNPISDVGYTHYLWKDIIVALGTIIAIIMFVINYRNSKMCIKNNRIKMIFALFLGMLLPIILFIALLYLYDFYRQNLI